MKSMKIILLALIAFTVPAHAQLRFGDIENKEVKEYIAQNDLCEIAEGLATVGDFEFALTTFKNVLETSIPPCSTPAVIPSSISANLTLA